MLKLIKTKNTSEFFTGERCFISEVLNDAAAPDMSVARCRVETGITTQLHALRGVTETYIITSGQGLMDDGANSAFQVGTGDTITISAGHAQRITNTGECDLVFTVICRPRFVPDCYVNLEDGT
ncbi:MAG: cupin domain-containing protein [Rhodobacteraceae bacterium]|nr:cupin domain-containing protein [Paracoccaceae bacterium]